MTKEEGIAILAQERILGADSLSPRLRLEARYVVKCDGSIVFKKKPALYNKEKESKYIAGNTGLEIKGISSSYRIYHINSGLYIGSYIFPRLKLAKLAVYELTALPIDWRVPKEEFTSGRYTGFSQAVQDILDVFYSLTS